ncbi:cardiolipin synthase [Bacillus manliponensis]|uniref:cardiolipin synthase n=1 Tax=Bacillus manliponensis TaxID=574376 RepID=UPI003510D861
MFFAISDDKTISNEIKLEVEVERMQVREYTISQVRYGNFQLYVDGHELYEQLFHDIRQAKQFVYIHFYIVRKDEISRRFLQLLQEKALEGVTVKLSVDRLGGYKVKKKFIQELKKHGVQFTFSNTPQLKNFFKTLHHRNHRRIAVIDGKLCYIGGFNIGKEYLGKDSHLGVWRDYQMRIEGDGAEDMEEQFVKDWYADTNEKLSLHHIFVEKGASAYRYIFTDGVGLWEQYDQLFAQAKQSIVIATPYFIPSKEMMNRIQFAMQKGIQVKILIPKKSDVLLFKQAAYPYLQQLLEFGAEIYRYEGGFFHGKVMLIDNDIVITGTTNFDNRSFYLNAESNCFIYDKQVVRDVQEKLQEDFEKAIKLSAQDFVNISKWDWFIAKIANVISFYL